MMSDDIVIQLKDFAATLKRGEGRSTVYGAASEIERLRKELLEAQKDLGLLRRARDRRDDEIERLRTELDQWRKTAAAYRYCGKCDWCEEQWDKATGNEQN